MKTNALSNRTAQRRVLSIFLFSAALVTALWAIVTSARTREESPLSKIAPWVIDHTAGSKQAEYLVVLSDQADLSGAAALRTRNEKGRYVRDVLWSKAQRSQAPILKMLRDRGVEHRSFYVVNMILVKGDLNLALELAARSDIARIEGNPLIQSVEEPLSIEYVSDHPAAPETIEPGIDYVHAPLVWAQGYTGQGVVVGGADTGYRWTHNALKNHYRGWNGTIANHNYNWHDSIHDSSG